MQRDILVAVNYSSLMNPELPAGHYYPDRFDKLTLFSPEAVCSPDEEEGDFSADPTPTISRRRTRIPTPIMMY